MNAIGYVRCTTCESLCRGYAPRGWKPGEELHTFRHSPEDGWGAACEGSYKVGTDTKLDPTYTLSVRTSVPRSTETRARGPR